MKLRRIDWFLVLIFFVLLLFAYCGGVRAGTPQITISVAPTTAVGTATPTVTWSTLGAKDCVATGAWSGSKAISGTETLPTVTTVGVQTYGLSCNSETGTVTLNWTIPTTNSDGTALTDLAGYRVLYGPAAGTVTNNVLISTPQVTTFKMTDIPTGPQYFVMRSVNSGGVQSANSNGVSTTVAADTGTQSATLTITAPAKPSPPGNFSVRPGA